MLKLFRLLKTKEETGTQTSCLKRTTGTTHLHRIQQANFFDKVIKQNIHETCIECQRINQAE